MSRRNQYNQQTGAEEPEDVEVTETAEAEPITEEPTVEVTVTDEMQAEPAPSGFGGRDPNPAHLGASGGFGGGETNPAHLGASGGFGGERPVNER